MKTERILIIHSIRLHQERTPLRKNLHSLFKLSFILSKFVHIQPWHVRYTPVLQGKRGVVQNCIDSKITPSQETAPSKIKQHPTTRIFAKRQEVLVLSLPALIPVVVLKKTALHTYLFVFLPVLQLYFSWDKCHEQTEEQLRHAERFLQKSTFCVCYSFNPFHSNLVWWMNSENLTIVLRIVSWFHNHMYTISKN